MGSRPLFPSGDPLSGGDPLRVMLPDTSRISIAPSPAKSGRTIAFAIQPERLVLALARDGLPTVTKLVGTADLPGGY